ncbi:ninja-family protein AFP3-like isoform X2 [Ipomoea triloba]|uniref:ninja-family protein AFP3-like isoform X2 n=1 Tax=Ipomoea triloba TaxID=35885 RepID=UPI00125E3E86|nr:ninja-family protein AFP3-like isoform X2 [Ipomoea triloba]
MHVHVGILELYRFMVYTMGDSEEARKSRDEMQNLSLDSTRDSRDLLQRFMEGGGSGAGKEGKEEDESEIELNLGLSLGGKFGVDRAFKNLVRSSSIAACLPTVRDDDAAAAAPPAYPTLVRTSSLPVETEEEWRKRKELQTLRRMQAKRRRSEKQRNSAAAACGGAGGGGGGGGSTLEDEKREIEKNFRGRLEREQYLTAAKRFGLSAPPQFGLPTWAAAASQAAFGGGIDSLKGKTSDFSNFSKVQGLGQPCSQGSVESQGGSSSSMSELESKSLQGSGDVSPGSFQSTQDTGSRDVGSSGVKTMDLASRMSGAEMEGTSHKPNSTSDQAREIGTNAMEDMPCVFTKGDGPNGKRIDGILYKYGKGQEVRIMCVCHGSFLSPAEFVKHAGGTDVAHPLKHIVIKPNSAPFL